MKIKKIVFDQFMGFSHAEYSFDGNAIISGANGTGKTTVGTAPYWVIADKDYSMNSNPEVHPTFLEESEPSIEIIYDINGKDVSFKKIQKDARTKKQKEEGVPVRIKNVYELNSVPKSQKDFDSALVEYGIDTNLFLLLTHPETYMDDKRTPQKSKREILFNMTTDITDVDIAKEMGFAETLILFETYKSEEIEAIMKKQKANASKRIDEIQILIPDKERSKLHIDVSSLNDQATSIQAKIDVVENELNQNPVSSVDQLNEQLLMNGQKIQMLIEDADRDRRKKYDDAKDAESETVKKLQSRRKEITERETVIAEETARKNNAKREFDRLGEEFAKAKAEDFDESSNFCKYCGQPLPADTAEENKRRFAKAKQDRMNEINHAALAQKNIMRDADDKKASAEEGIPEIKSAILVLEHELEEAETASKIFETPVDVSSTDEYKKLVEEQESIKQKIADRDKAVEEQADKRFAIRTWKEELRKVQDELAMVKVNASIDKQISKLREEQKQKAQAVADAEKILYQLSQISMKKNELLEEQVNSHFTRVKFRLFKYLKNGDVKDDCTPMVLNSNGEYMDATFSANTAAIILAKLDIIAGLQKFYGVNYPVILDGAEALDSENSNIDVPYQLIMLKVTDDKELVIA